MQIEYKNNAIRKVCTNATVATKKHGDRMAELIHRRIDEISAAENVEELVQYGIGRCHELVGDRKKQYAMDLVHPYRLIFKKNGTDIQIAYIIDISDYH